ncbi:leucyl/phenylalanyl-tRNA--protein transferase [Halopseudomonas salegens]|uniref:Leucyl/phenylalanyl-tRNA--protein transferase n=1 Tax=Halopseudomonas salegens TaxID=1434072 RepID=A0A1H2FJ60_9GAMM|nr:leucyl/phenylalanyl-tRNA--protein transferase [Halopseudomonas salegens]SDU07365.1 leucyl/phenylalanyl-tRNA--protein transferase [Halopseudomonas salegens]
MSLQQVQRLTWLDPDDLRFPPPEQALDDPNGLIALGGDLRPQRLIKAYRQGIFPWYQDDQPLLWWCPDPRTVVTPDSLHVSRSMQKFLRKTDFRVSFDQDFPAVIRACAAPRSYADDTWITDDMQAAYSALHRLGIAHSVEVWQQDQLVGGLYGIALGRVFFGESMFSWQTNASKTAFIHLVRQLGAWNFALIDCQMPTDHLFSLGAQSMSRSDFLQQLARLCPADGPNAWGQSQ